MGDGTVYQSSEGEYFGDAEVWERFESGMWVPCCWNAETGKEWVKTQDGDLLLLIPISRHALPDWNSISHDADGIRIRKNQQEPAE